ILLSCIQFKPLNMKRIILLLLGGLSWLSVSAQALQTGFSPPIPQIGRGSVAWADYNNNGQLDLLLCGIDSSGMRQSVLLQKIGNAFVPDTAQHLIGVSGGDADWADMEGDGDLDLVLTGEKSAGHGATAVYQNQGGALSLLATPNLPGLSMGQAVWADFDHDGDQDIFLTGFSEVEGFVGMIAINDAGTFTAVKNPLFATREWTAADVGDFNADGLPDIAFSDRSPKISEPMRVMVLKNVGGMQFVSVPLVLDGFYGGSLDFADLEGDGDLDLLCTGINSKPVTQVCKYIGGQFVSTSSALVAVSDGEAVWMDFDHDGDPDIVEVGRTSSGLEMRAYRNNGGVFSLFQSPSTMPSITNARMAVGDWNQDGFVDFAVMGTDANDIPRSYIGTWFNGLQQFKF
ncbi:MAG: hypothetical protein RLZZ519_3342, partial [Bacteroidota bacterium]